MTDPTTFRLDTVDLACEFGWEVEHFSRVDEFTRHGVAVLVQYSPDDSITSLTRTRPNRAEEIFAEESQGKEQRLRMWLTGQTAPPARQPVQQMVTSVRAGSVPKLRWSREGWMHRRTGEVVDNDDPRVPKTVDAAKKDRDLLLVGSQANIAGGYYRRDLDESTGQSSRPIYTATWHPDARPTVELARTGGLEAYFACVRHYQNSWPQKAPAHRIDFTQKPGDWTRDEFIQAVDDPDDRSFLLRLLELVDANERLPSAGPYPRLYFGVRGRGAMHVYPFGLRHPPFKLNVKDGRLLVSGCWDVFPDVKRDSGFSELASMLGLDELGTATRVPVAGLDPDELWHVGKHVSREIN